MVISERRPQAGTARTRLRRRLLASAGPLRRRTVLIVGLNYAPEPTGIARYTTGLARMLADAGHSRARRHRLPALPGVADRRRVPGPADRGDRRPGGEPDPGHPRRASRPGPSHRPRPRAHGGGVRRPRRHGPHVAPRRRGGRQPGPPVGGGGPVAVAPLRTYGSRRGDTGPLHHRAHRDRGARRPRRECRPASRAGPAAGRRRRRGDPRHLPRLVGAARRRFRPDHRRAELDPHRPGHRRHRRPAGPARAGRATT